MAYKLLGSWKTTRLYRLDNPITKSYMGKSIFFMERGKPLNDRKLEYTEIQYVIISDAVTHLERVAFAARFVNCEDEAEGIEAYKAGLTIPTHRRFADESRYEQPFVEVEFGQNLGGRISWLIDGWGGSNLDLIMEDKEILKEIIDANKAGEERR